MAILRKQETGMFNYVIDKERMRRLDKDCDILKTEGGFPLITNYCIELAYFSPADPDMRRTKEDHFFIIPGEKNPRSSKGMNAIYLNIDAIIIKLKNEIGELKDWQGRILDGLRDGQFDAAKILSQEVLEAAEFLLRYWENLKEKLGQT